MEEEEEMEIPFVLRIMNLETTNWRLVFVELVGGLMCKFKARDEENL